MEHPAVKKIALAAAALSVLAAAPAQAQQAATAAEIERLKSRLDAQQRQIQDLEGRLREAAPVTTTPPPTDTPDTRAGAEVVSGGDFPGSFRLPGSELSVKIGGYVKADAIVDFDPIGSEDLFATSTIPTTDDPNFDTRTRFHARQTRFNVDAQKQDTPYGQFRAFVEIDFFGTGGNQIVSNSYDPRLRHAYGSLGPILAGQTWSTFMDVFALPELLDFQGPNGQTFIRQAQLRYTADFGGGASLAAALENPEADVVDGAGNRINSDELPDFVLRARWEQDWGHLQTGALLRQLTVRRSAAPALEDEELGWGLNLSGKFKLGKKDNAYFQINGGDGIGRYIFDIAGSSADALVTPAGTAIETLEAMGGFVGAQHWWAETLRSSLVYSRVEVDVKDYQPGTALETSQYAAVNLIWSPIPQTSFGVEYLHGRREDKSGAEGKANRLQLSSQFLF